MRLLARRTLATLLLPLLLSGTVAHAQSSPAEQRSRNEGFSLISFAQGDSLAAQLANNRYTLALEGGRLRGAGAELLFREAQASQFFMIGEDHGIAELPLFTAALFRQLKPYGYTRYATEAGPITARWLEKLAATRSPQNALTEFNHQNPFSVPFYYWQEEGKLLETVVQTNNGRPGHLWGLDQEFFLSSKLHLQRLLEITRDRQARQVVDEYYQRALTEYERMVESKNPGIVFLASAKEEDFKRLEEALRPRAGTEAAEIFSELKESWEIYRKIFQGKGYESNLQRAALMKRHFMRYYNEARRRERTPPRVLFKFGVNHMKRGRSFINSYDLGTFIPELAAANGTKAFQLLVIGASGTQNTYLPFVGNESGKKKRYDVINVMSEYARADVKPLLAAARGETNWVLIDFRPLRPLLPTGRLGRFDKGLEELMWSFDAVLVIPEIHAATLY